MEFNTYIRDLARRAAPLEGVNHSVMPGPSNIDLIRAMIAYADERSFPMSTTETNQLEAIFRKLLIQTTPGGSSTSDSAKGQGKAGSGNE